LCVVCLCVFFFVGMDSRFGGRQVLTCISFGTDVGRSLHDWTGDILMIEGGGHSLWVGSTWERGLGKLGIVVASLLGLAFLLCTMRHRGNYSTEIFNEK